MVQYTQTCFDASFAALSAATRRGVLEQLGRALNNGLHLGWITADIWYGEKPAFIEGLEALGLPRSSERGPIEAWQGL